LHKRLQEERRRLEINQDEFAEIGGVKRRAQINYESGDRCPDGHYFSAIAAIGADVQYILTGKRSLNPLGDSSLGKYRQYMMKSSAETVEALGLENSPFGENLEGILFFVGLGKTKDEIDAKSEAKGVIEAMQGYANSNLTIAEKDLLAAYRKAAKQDQASIERMAQLAADAAQDEAEPGESVNIEGEKHE